MKNFILAAIALATVSAYAAKNDVICIDRKTGSFLLYQGDEQTFELLQKDVPVQYWAIESSAAVPGTSRFIYTLSGIQGTVEITWLPVSSEIIQIDNRTGKPYLPNVEKMVIRSANGEILSTFADNCHWR